MTNKTISSQTTQQPESISYTSNSRTGFKTERVAELSVGGGGTQGFVNDCYPLTVWGWEQRGQKLIVYVTHDRYHFEKAKDWTEANQKGEYIYTSIPPTNESPAVGIVVTQRGNNGYSFGTRCFYQNPSF